MNIDNKMSRRDCIVKLQSVGVPQSGIDLLVRSNLSRYGVGQIKKNKIWTDAILSKVDFLPQPWVP